MAIDWEKAVDKLARMTRDGKVQWSAIELDLFESLTERHDGEVRDPAYFATIKDRLVLVYEYRYKRYTDEYEWHWEDEVGIEFVGDNYILEYEWPQVPGRRQLLDTIRLKVTKADKFIEEFLAD